MQPIWNEAKAKAQGTKSKVKSTRWPSRQRWSRNDRRWRPGSTVTVTVPRPSKWQRTLIWPTLASNQTAFDHFHEDNWHWHTQDAQGTKLYEKRGRYLVRRIPSVHRAQNLHEKRGRYWGDTLVGVQNCKSFWSEKRHQQNFYQSSNYYAHNQNNRNHSSAPPPKFYLRKIQKTGCEPEWSLLCNHKMRRSEMLLHFF